MEQAKEYLRRMLKVLIFIDEHLDEEMSLDELAKIACYSPFHFHRIFQTVSGETIHSYVKRLRMEKAAGRLRYTDQPITEIALEAGYETPSAFTRAFRQWRGASPQDFRTLNKLEHELTYKLQEIAMIEPNKIETIRDISVLFIRRYGEYTKSPREAWEAMEAFIDTHRLDHSQLRRFGIAHDDPKITDKEKLRYDAAISLAELPKAEGEFGHQILKAGKYAVFTHRGPYEMLEKTFERLFLKWLPQSGKQIDEERPIFSEYFNMEQVYTDPTQLITHIYVSLLE